MKKVAIINYGMGNLDSVARAVQECGGSPVITDQHRDLESVSHIILPGVGAFGDGIRNLREKGLDEVLGKQVVDQGIPFLGICLGMQLIATEGLEGVRNDGLGWIKGVVKRLEPDSPTTRIPHVGWNEVHCGNPSTLFDGIPSGTDFYFVHSYHFECAEEANVRGLTPYCGGFVSAIKKENIYGVQFHPEKSQGVGFKLIKNFLSL